MQLSRISKWSVILLAICCFIGLLTGCGRNATNPAANPNESVPPEDETESMGRLSEITTDFGTLYIPQKYEQSLQTEISSGNGSVTVNFSAEQDGKKYTLFNLNIGEGAGELAGTLTDKNGTSREVYVTVYDLGDISGLSQDKQDQLYAMQEAVNVIVENMK